MSKPMLVTMFPNEGGDIWDGEMHDDNGTSVSLGLTDLQMLTEDDEIALLMGGHEIQVWLTDDQTEDEEDSWDSWESDEDDLYYEGGEDRYLDASYEE